MQKTAIFNSKKVRYRPGRIVVCPKLNLPDREWKPLIDNLGGKIIEKHQPEVYEVDVPWSATCQIASKLLESGNFRFVELDRDGF